MSVESTTASIIAACIGAAAGLGGFFWGFFTYKREQRSRRKEVLFPLIEEFDKSNQMEYAKDILDGKNVTPEAGWKYPWGYYNRFDLILILRDGQIYGIDERGEVAIRCSFDALLDFFCKLEYLLKIELVKPDEVEYFRYYIDIAACDDAILRYLNYYNFPLEGRLNERLKRTNNNHKNKMLSVSANPSIKIEDEAKRYLTELDRMSKIQYVKSYILGHNLGFTTDQTIEIIDYLKERALITQRTPIQEGEYSNLEITDKGNDYLSGNRSSV